MAKLLSTSSNGRHTDDIGSYVHDQGPDGTCYAQAVATVIADTAISLGRQHILKVVIKKFGTSGWSTEEAGEFAVEYFEKYLPPQAKFVELTEAEADKRVAKQHKVVLSFGLSAPEWTAFKKHFSSGKDCNVVFGPGHVPQQQVPPTVESRHSVVLEAPAGKALKQALGHATVR